MQSMTKKKTTPLEKTGPKSLFRGKLRHLVVTATFTEEHHRILRRTCRRLGLSRSDVLGLLIENYGDVVERPTTESRALFPMRSVPCG